MNPEERDLLDVQFAYSDIESRMTILAKRGEVDNLTEKRDTDSASRTVSDYLAGVHGRICGLSDNGGQNCGNVADDISKNLEARGKAFQHTEEYYVAMEAKAKADRMRAYREITATGLNTETEEEKDIRANPFSYLGLEEGATFGQVRDAWRQHARMWHEDMMRPDDIRSFRTIFGQDPHGNFPIDGFNADEWSRRLLAFAPPVILPVEEVENMSEEGRLEYVQSIEAHRQMEEEYAAVKMEMVRRAHEKMINLKIAYEAICSKFSRREIESVAGFSWNEGESSGLMGTINQKFEYIHLEGGAELQRNNRFVDPSGNLFLSLYDSNEVGIHFDRGEVYLADRAEYRQSIDLQTFFAWLDLIQLRELSPQLLRGIEKSCSLSPNQREQLRVMLTNHEDISVILEVLSLGDEKKKDNLISFITTVYFGPSCDFQIDRRNGAYYPLGVELDPDGSMTFKYHNQSAPGCSLASFPDQTQFTKADVTLMRSLAYGPMLEGG
jgi:hypothetical protein